MYGTTITILTLVVIGFTTWQGLNKPWVMQKYILSTEAISLRRERYRYLSPAFLHADWGHYGFNAISIFLFGGMIEDNLGPGYFIMYFLLSVMGGSLMSVWLNRGTEYRALGASGGALGLVFAAIFIFPGMKVGMLLLPFYIPGWLFAALYLLYTLYGTKVRLHNISHEGHLGGLLTGMILAAIRFPGTVWQQAPLFFFVIAVTSIALWYFHRNPARVPGFFRMQLDAWLGRRKHESVQKESTLVDDLLEKVSREGISSLSGRERKLLEKASKNRRNRA